MVKKTGVKWNEWQILAAVGTVAMVIVLIAILAQGLGMYETQIEQDQERMRDDMVVEIPRDPEGTATVLVQDAALEGSDMEAELKTEMETLDQEVQEVDQLTKSYE